MPSVRRNASERSVSEGSAMFPPRKKTLELGSHLAEKLGKSRLELNIIKV